MTGREAFAHDAVLALDAHGDDRAPGGAITRALCGSWSHEPPCPLAPHHTGARRDGDEVTLRVLFAAAPDDEARVRALIDEALGRGEGEDPDGTRTSWRLLGSGASPSGRRSATTPGGCCGTRPSGRRTEQAATVTAASGLSALGRSLPIMSPAVAITLGAVNVEADSPRALAAFWAELLGTAVAGDSDGPVFLAAREPDGFGMFFRPRTGPRPERQGSHLDLTVPWGSREAEVGRAVGLGATHRWDVLDEVPWVQWSTLADPEGNLFCIAEHPPTA